MTLIEALFGRPANQSSVALSTKRWGMMDLNKMSQELNHLATEIDLEEIDFLNPSTQGAILTAEHKKLDIDYSYGGYLEDRSAIWKGSYLPPDSMIHLGIDFNVPAGTPIAMPINGRTVFAIHDKDQNGGWGGRVDFFNDDLGVYFILAHLDPSAALHTPGVHLGKGVMAGFIGTDKVNGGWFPHLHVQCVAKYEYERFSNPMEIDGYGKMLPDLKDRYPSPEILVK